MRDLIPFLLPPRSSRGVGDSGLYRGRDALMVLDSASRIHVRIMSWDLTVAELATRGRGEVWTREWRV